MREDYVCLLVFGQAICLRGVGEQCACRNTTAREKKASLVWVSLKLRTPREEVVVAKERRMMRVKAPDGQRGHGERERAWCMRTIDAEVLCGGGFRGE
jgi:hypothetical protein